MNTMRTAAAGLLAIALVGSGAGAAQAKGGDDRGEVRASGSCSGSTHWKLKGKHDDGRLEVEAEIDSNRNDQRWRMRITDNGVRVFKGRRTTHRPSGSFEVERHIRNRAGNDRIRVVARNLRNGERCVGVVVVRP